MQTNNFNTILKYSLKTKLNKSFLKFAVGFIVCAIIVINIIPVVLLFKSDTDLEMNVVVPVSDNINYKDIANAVKTNDNIIVHEQKDYDYHDLSTSDMELYLDVDTNTVYSQSDMDFEAENFSREFFTAIKSSKIFNEMNLSKEDLNEIATLGQYETVNLKDINDDGRLENETDKSLYYAMTFIITMIAYMILVFAMQFIGQEILEEKTSRAMEIIITNIKPSSHMIAKVVSNLLYIVSIGLVMSIGVTLGGLIALSIMDIDISMLFIIIQNVGSEISPLGIIAFVSFIVFLLLLSTFIILTITAIMASSSSTMEDYQKMISPITILLVIPFYMNLFMDNVLISKIASFIPIFTFFMLPNLILSGDVSLLFVVSTVIVNIITLILLIKFGSYVYKEGVLNYASKSAWQMLKQTRTNYKYNKKNK